MAEGCTSQDEAHVLTVEGTADVQSLEKLETVLLSGFNRITRDLRKVNVVSKHERLKISAVLTSGHQNSVKFDTFVLRDVQFKDVLDSLEAIYQWLLLRDLLDANIH